MATKRSLAAPLFAAMLALLTLGTRPLAAQRLWLDPAPNRAIGVVATLGLFDGQRADFPTGTLALRGRIPVGDGFVATVELPMARAATSSEFGPSTSGTAVGNPWIGFETAPEHGVTLELGVRPSLWSPDNSEDALPWGFGGVLDFDRWDAWFVRASSIRFAAQIGTVPEHGPFLTATVGGTGLVPRGTGGDSELLADYAVRLGVASPSLVLSAAVIGHGIVTHGGGSLGDRTIHQGELRAVFGSGSLRPEVSVRRYVGEHGNGGVKAIIRVGLTMAQ